MTNKNSSKELIIDLSDDQLGRLASDGVLTLPVPGRDEVLKIVATELSIPVDEIVGGGTAKTPSGVSLRY